MGKIKVGDNEWIKSIDRTNGVIEFTTNENEAYDREDGDWYTRAEVDYIKFHFAEKYPKVANARADDDDY